MMDECCMLLENDSGTPDSNRRGDPNEPPEPRTAPFDLAARGGGLL